MASPPALIHQHKMGEGAYGTVYAVQATATSKVMAYKRNFVERWVDGLARLRELDMCTRLRGHPHIVEIVATATSHPFSAGTLSPANEEKKHKDDSIHFLFEIAQIDLHNLILYGYHGHRLTFPLLMEMIVHLLLGLEFIHGKGIIHRDIKPCNLLIAFPHHHPLPPLSAVLGGTSIIPSVTGGVLKICDFGLSKPYTPQGDQTPRTITHWYRALEVLLRRHYNQKVDVWSVGSVIYEAVTGRGYMEGLVTDNEMQAIIIILSMAATPISKEVQDAISTSLGVPWGDIARQLRPKSYVQHIIEYNGQPRAMTLKPAELAAITTLLSGLLVLEPSRRMTATQALALPLFNEHRDYINLVRSQFPPHTPYDYTITLTDCRERRWATTIAVNIFNHRDRPELKAWYSHAKIFQAIDLFDRFIAASTPQPDGTYMSQRRTISSFLACLYMVVKYYSSIVDPPSYMTLVSTLLLRPILPASFPAGRFMNDAEIKSAVAFESALLAALGNTMHRSTCYEAAVVVRDSGAAHSTTRRWVAPASMI